MSTQSPSRMYIHPPPQALVASWEDHAQSGEGLRNLVKMAPASRQQINLYIILNINRI
jgi:hypothetical protein